MNNQNANMNQTMTPTTMNQTKDQLTKIESVTVTISGNDYLSLTNELQALREQNKALLEEMKRTRDYIANHVNV